MSHNDIRPAMNRRTALKAAAAAGVTGSVGLWGLRSALPASASPAFAHPGMLHTRADLDRMAAKVAAGTGRWAAGYAKLAANRHAQSTWKANPQAVVYRGAGSENYPTQYHDIHAAYQNALRWRITGETAHADAARDILNAWSAKLTKLDGSADRFILAGIHGYQFANAAELMRDYPGFDLARFQRMMLHVFYPVNDSFLTDHNGAYITNYWASWDLLSVASVLAIGILCDDRAKVDQAVTYFRNGAGNGSVRHAIPVIHPGGLGQVTEVGRDQGHALLSIGLMATICEMAWNQGVDLYGYDDNRFLKGAEYAAKWNLGQNVPYTPYTWHKGAPSVWSGTDTFTAASPDSRGQIRPIWEGIYHHYVNRRGLTAPYVTAMASRVRPEGGGGDYGPNSGGFDHLGFGTLVFTRERAGGPAAAHPTAAASPSDVPTAHRTGTTAGGAAPQGGGRGLAATGAGGLSAIAGTGVLATAVGFLALRRRRHQASR
ncbi:alginate lyase family protein [Streptomyces sp. NPDC051976]|uniref:alginate lyase family protein n=1 Tax=Streptomyces sp. NPDC051976 TaxID=3154947 RepID=UPI003412DCA4